MPDSIEAHGAVEWSGDQLRQLLAALERSAAEQAGITDEASGDNSNVTGVCAAAAAAATIHPHFDIQPTTDQVVLVPWKFGEIVPLHQLMPVEVDARSRRTTGVAFLEDRRSLRSTVSVYGLLGLLAGGLACLAVIGAARLEYHLNRHKTGGLHNATSAVFGNVSNVMLLDGTSIRFRMEHGNPPESRLTIPRGLIENADIAFIWLRDLPSGSAVSQGLKFDTGPWVLSRAQLRDLNVSVPATNSGPMAVTVDFMGRNGDLVAQMKHPLVAAGNRSRRYSQQ